MTRLVLDSSMDPGGPCNVREIRENSVVLGVPGDPPVALSAMTPEAVQVIVLSTNFLPQMSTRKP